MAKIADGTRQYHCRGCGVPLPFGFRGLFHPDCLKADKRRRTREKRRVEREKFEAWLRRLQCRECETSLGRVQKRVGNLTRKPPVKLHTAPQGSETARGRCQSAARSLSGSDLTRDLAPGSVAGLAGKEEPRRKESELGR